MSEYEDRRNEQIALSSYVKLIELLNEPGVRISLSPLTWMVYDGHEWFVYNRPINAKKIQELYSGDSLLEAIEVARKAAL